MRNFYRPGRSVAMGTHGAAATSHQQATLTAAEVLRGGGSAVDAAVAAAALLGVIEPNSTGIGGDSFALLWQANEGKLYGINGSGHAPEGLSTDWLLKQEIDRIDQDSTHSVLVPGALRCWETLLDRFGRHSLGEMLVPAITAAREGFPVAERIAHDWELYGYRLNRHQESREVLLPRGAAPAPGTMLRFPKLAETLRRVAEGGADAFYTGEIAAAMVQTLNELGGRHSAEDFSVWRPEFVTPITTRYRDVEVHQTPPNGQGLMVSMMLNVLEGFEHSKLDPMGADQFHLQIEAYRLAVAARDEFIADPARADVPIEDLISERYAEALRSRIDTRRAMSDPVVEPAGPSDTVYLATADSEGNMCSFISSLSAAFGSAILCPRTGVLFQNRGSGFVVQPGHRNTVEPRKRSLHTIIPGFATRGGAPWLSFGVMHGFYQPVGQVQVLQNIVDYGMSVQEAIDAPRGLRDASAFHTEPGVPEATLLELMRRGHPVALAREPWGGAQAILRDGCVLHAGSDPRKDGVALAW